MVREYPSVARGLHTAVVASQVCVVYCQELKCWCRAVIKSLVSLADHHLAECFLVDFAKYIPVKSKKYVWAPGWFSL